MSYSLVKAGSVVTGSSGGSITTLAFGQSPTAGNLLILTVAVDGSATVPATPSGWSSAVTNAGTSSASGIFYKVAVGGDSAPTLSAISGAVQIAQLYEFSGGPTSGLLDKTGSAAGTSSAQTVSCSAADSNSGDLVIKASAILGTSRSRTLSETFNNGGTLVRQSSSGTTTADHYDFAYDLGTTSNSSADSASLTFTTTGITGVTSVIASFNSGPALPWSYVQGAGSGNSSSSTLSIGLSGVTAGNRLIGYVYVYGSGITLSGASDSLGNQGATSGQFDVALVAADGYSGHLYCVTAPITAAGTDTITFTASGTASYLAGWIGEYSGLSTGVGASAWDVLKSATGGTSIGPSMSTGSTPPTTADNEPAIAAVGYTIVGNGFPTTTPSGWSELYNNTATSGTHIDMAVAQQNAPTTGTSEGATWTVGSVSGNSYAAAVVVFKLAGAATPGATGSGSGKAVNPTASGSGTFSIPTYHGSGSVVAKQATVTGSGTQTPPSYHGSGSAISKSATASGTGTISPPGYHGSGSGVSKNPTASGVGSFITPSYHGSGAALAKQATATGSGTAPTPGYHGSGTAKAGQPTATGAGHVTAPVYHGSGVGLARQATASGTGHQGAPAYTGMGSGITKRATATAAGSFITPVHGSGTAQSPRTTTSGQGRFIPPVWSGSGLAVAPAPQATGSGHAYTPAEVRKGPTAIVAAKVTSDIIVTIPAPTQVITTNPQVEAVITNVNTGVTLT